MKEKVQIVICFFIVVCSIIVYMGVCWMPAINDIKESFKKKKEKFDSVKYIRQRLNDDMFFGEIFNEPTTKKDIEIFLEKQLKEKGHEPEKYTDEQLVDIIKNYIRYHNIKTIEEFRTKSKHS